jgi:hypothetical protein
MARDPPDQLRDHPAHRISYFGAGKWATGIQPDEELIDLGLFVGNDGHDAEVEVVEATCQLRISSAEIPVPKASEPKSRVVV